MNTVQLIGRLTRDPEVKYTQSQMAVATFSIAIDRIVRDGEDKKADYPRIVVFGRQAENCERYLIKGRLVGIEGRLQTGSYDDKNGNKVYTTDVVANRVEFLEWGDKPSELTHVNPQAVVEQAKEALRSEPTQEIPEGIHLPSGIHAMDDDIPF